MRHQTFRALAALTLIAAAAAAPLAADIIAPGFNVTTHAELVAPAKFAFADDGAIVIGRDGVGPTGSPQDPFFVRTITGGAVSEFGDAAITDPDAIYYDHDGAITGTAGTTLVGSRLNGAMATITAISPAGAVSEFLAPTTAAENPTAFVRLNDQLIFADYDRSDVKIVADGTPATLFQTPSRVFSLTADPIRGHIYTADIAGRVRKYDTTGTLLNGAVLTGLGDTIALTYVARGRSDSDGGGSDGDGGDGGDGDEPADEIPLPGGALYVINTAGDLLQLTDSGELTTLATGFDFAYDMHVGPDGALYVAEYNRDRLVRLAMVPEPTTLLTLLVGAATLALRRR